MLPSGMMTTFRHNQQLFHNQPPSNPKFYHSSTVSRICSAHIHVGHISEATRQFHEFSFNMFLIMRLYLYWVIILSDKYQSPLSVSLSTVLINHSPGQQSSVSQFKHQNSSKLQFWPGSSKPQFRSATHHILTVRTSRLLQTQAATILTLHM